MNKQYYSLFAFLFFFVANAQIINISDANFKAKLLSANPSNGIASTQTPDSDGKVTNYNTIDTNSDGEIQVSEASLIKYLDIISSEISNLEGINSFNNLLYLHCSHNQLTSLDVSGLTNLKTLFCNRNQITSLNVSGLTNLTTLFCEQNPIMSLNVSGLSNLITLICNENQLTSLNVSGLNELKTLECYNNQLKSLDVSGLSNLNALSCFNNQITSLNVSELINLYSLNCSSNQLKSLDVSGLINLYFFDCSNNQLASINVSGLTNLWGLVCNNNQFTSFDLSGLTNLNTLYCFNNQITSLNVSGLTNLFSLDCSSNQLKSLDVSGLTKMAYLFCNDNQLKSLDVTGLTNLESLGCSANQLTSLFIKNRNPFWGFLFFDSNPNLIYICADDEDLEFVQNEINTYGYSKTCQVNSYCSFTPGGVFYTINGENKLDANNDGCDASDIVYPNLKYTITDGTISENFISNTLGNYVIPVSAGTYTITPQLENQSYFTVTPISKTFTFPTSESSSYFTVSPANSTVTLPTTASMFVQDFCIAPNGVHHDLEVVIAPLEPARPGFDATYKIIYKNKGTVLETATLVLDFDDSFSDYIASTVAPTSQSIGKISWDIGTLAPFETGEIVVTLNVNSPMETPAVNGGDILSFIAAVSGLNTDETPVDNSFALRQIVVNSFDPNDKTCLEGNTIHPRMIGEYVHYKIRFENTGTYPAQNIVVKDMIDTTKFDISTLQMTDATHRCVTRISNPDKVEFIFENINLPFDDATNDGYVVFKIKTKPTLGVGDNISNVANIYFDYNFPIVTNTATSTFQTLANKAFNLDNYVSLSPNPAKDLLNISIQDVQNAQSIRIYNMLGQLVQITTSPSKTIDVSNLKTGNYIIQFNTEKGEISKKFVKE